MDAAGIHRHRLLLFFGALMAGLAATTLLWKGTPLDCIWGLNPTAYAQLAPRAARLTLGTTFSSSFGSPDVLVSQFQQGWCKERRRNGHEYHCVVDALPDNTQ